MQDTVGVYYSGQDFTIERPAFFVDRGTARQWLRTNIAWSIHHGRDIALSSEMEQKSASAVDGAGAAGEFDAQLSQIMGETVMRANAERERWAVNMTRSWNPRIARTEHVNSLQRYRRLKSGPRILPCSAPPRP